jgi:hypothetical protein
MRILLLAHSFNSLTQRLHVELIERGHTVSVELDINDAVTREAVALFDPDLVLAPFLKRAIPEDVWRARRCLIVQPGIVGDRGPSSLDWAILRGEEEWGVTVLEAEAEMDAGPVWAAVTFPMREATKSSLYRREVTAAAVEAVLTALARIEMGGFTPARPDPADPAVRGRARPAFRQADRAIDWARDATDVVRLPSRGAREHAAQLLRLRSELPRGALQLHLQGAQVAHALDSRAASAPTKWSAVPPGGREAALTASGRRLGGRRHGHSQPQLFAMGGYCWVAGRGRRTARNPCSRTRVSVEDLKKEGRSEQTASDPQSADRHGGGRDWQDGSSTQVKDRRTLVRYSS